MNHTGSWSFPRTPRFCLPPGGGRQKTPSKRLQCFLASKSTKSCLVDIFSPLGIPLLQALCGRHGIALPSGNLLCGSETPTDPERPVVACRAQNPDGPNLSCRRPRRTPLESAVLPIPDTRPEKISWRGGRGARLDGGRQFEGKARDVRSIQLFHSAILLGPGAASTPQHKNPCKTCKLSCKHNSVADAHVTRYVFTRSLALACEVVTGAVGREVVADLVRFLIIKKVTENARCPFLDYSETGDPKNGLFLMATVSYLRCPCTHAFRLGVHRLLLYTPNSRISVAMYVAEICAVASRGLKAHIQCRVECLERRSHT